jgi:hypothetical protein
MDTQPTATDSEESKKIALPSLLDQIIQTSHDPSPSATPT